MIPVSTYSAEILIYTGRLAEPAKSAHGHASRKKGIAPPTQYYMMLGSLNWSARGQSYGINNLISIYRLFYFEDEVFYNIYKCIL